MSLRCLVNQSSKINETKDEIGILALALSNPNTSLHLYQHIELPCNYNFSFNVL